MNPMTVARPHAMQITISTLRRASRCSMTVIRESSGSGTDARGFREKSFTSSGGHGARPQLFLVSASALAGSVVAVLATGAGGACTTVPGPAVSSVLAERVTYFL